MLTVGILTALGVLPRDRARADPEFVEWNPPASRTDSLLRFRLAWSWVDDGRGQPDSFEVQVRLKRSQGNSQLLVDRRVRSQEDTFSVEYPPASENLYFSGTLRAYRHSSLSVPTSMTWQYPRLPDQRLPVPDTQDPRRHLVEFPSLSMSPRRTQPRNITSAPQRSEPTTERQPKEEPASTPRQPDAGAPSAVSSNPGGLLTSCGNEPVGYEPLATRPWDDVPPRSSQKGPDGWTVTARRERIRMFIDANAPSGSKRVLEGKFPQGAPGGRGPFRMDLIFRRHVSTVYMCVWMKLSDNFTNNGNTGTKFGFFLTPYEGTNKYLNHYFNLTNRLGINLQSARATLNRQMQSNFPTTRNLGAWHRIEWLIVANSSGMSNGTARMWVDGRQVLNINDVQYFFPGQEPAFKGVSWNPTYGGGLNPVPYDLYQWVSDWYISGR